MQRIAITGANGFLGRALCRLAASHGYAVTAVVRQPCELAGVSAVVTTTLENSRALIEAFTGCNAVIHTAGLAHVFGKAAVDEKAFHAANALGTRAVAQAASTAQVPHLVLASSVSVYGGAGRGGVTESAYLQPCTAYARSKQKAEQGAAAAFASHGCLSTLRFATLYGPGDRGNVARLITALQRRRFLWPGTGQNRKSLVYVDDAARACFEALQRQVGGIYNISAPAVTMQEIVAAICDALGRPMPRVRIPDAVLRLAASVAASQPMFQPLQRQLQAFLQDDVYLAAKFQSQTRWEPQLTMQQGIALQVASVQPNTFTKRSNAKAAMDAPTAV